MNTTTEYRYEQGGKIYRTARAAKAAITKAEGVEGKQIATERLGSELLEQYVERFMRLTSIDRAIGRPDWRKLSQSKVSEGIYPRLTKADFYRHLGEIQDRTLFGCAGPERLDSGEGTVVWVAVDIDNEDHQPLDQSDTAQRVREDLENKLSSMGVVFVTQESTHSSGFHVHFCIVFPSNPSFSRIRQLLCQVRSSIQSCYSKSGCSEVCLKGLPFVSNDNGPAEFGTLVRSPLPRSPSEAQALLDMTDRPTEFSTLLAGFSKGALSSSRKKLTPANPSLALGPKTDSLPSLSLQVISKGGHSENVSQNGKGYSDPLTRMNHAAAKFARENKRHPNDAAELVSYYEAEGFSTPVNDTERSHTSRLVRAEAALEWIRANHRFKLPSRMKLYTHWLKQIDSLGLIKDDLTYTASGRSIKTQHVALVMAMVEQNILKGDGSTPKTFAVKGSRKMKRDGDISFTLDNKKFAKATSVLLSLGLLTVVRQPQRGLSTEYGHGQNYESMKL